MSKYDVSLDAMRHYYRGRVFEATGELDIAIEEYKKAIEYGADYADVHNSLGRALAKKGFLEEARIEFEKALRLNPRYLEAQRNLNELLTKISILSKEKFNTQQTIKEESITVFPQPEKEIKPQSQKLVGFKIPLKISLLFGISILILFFALLCKKFVLREKLPIQKFYETTLETISSINAIDNKLVLSSWSSQEVAFYKIKGDFLFMITSFKLSRDNIIPTSICFVSNYLYILDAWNKKIYKYVIVKGKNILLKVVNLSQTEPICIVAYKNNILVFDNKDKQIVVYDKDLNKVIEKFPYLVKDIIYASSYKDKIWILDKNYTLYKLKGYKEIVNSYKLDFLANRVISSFFIDKNSLWLSEEGNSHLINYNRSIIE